MLSEALANNTSVIVSYHPPIFKSLRSLTLGNPLQSSLLQCAAQGISVYSPHTALDSVWGGVNDWLADGVLAGKPENGIVSSLLGDELRSADATEGGEGRLVTLHSSIKMEVLEGRIKGHLKLSHSEHCLSPTASDCPVAQNVTTEGCLRANSTSWVRYPDKWPPIPR